MSDEQRAFLRSVEFAPSDKAVWAEFKRRNPGGSHDDFSLLWSWARRMGYCGNVEVKTYELLWKGQRALKRDSDERAKADRD